MTWTLLAKRLVQNQSLSWGKIFVVFYRKSIFLDLVLLLYYSPFVCDIHMVESKKCTKINDNSDLGIREAAVCLHKYVHHLIHGLLHKKKMG